jgi:ectoine hydroxylase-related dioxygenase (phytanoyl-CoA dioxygenase family)
MAENFLSCMVSIDAATIENGCLQVSSGRFVKNEIPLTEQGIIESEAEDNMTFQYVTCVPGDIVLFDGYLPHRSHTNTSTTQRRAVFLTYNPASEGDHHGPYYAAKHNGHSGFNTNATISFQGDFQGVIVE